MKIQRRWMKEMPTVSVAKECEEGWIGAQVINGVGEFYPKSDWELVPDEPEMEEVTSQFGVGHPNKSYLAPSIELTNESGAHLPKGFEWRMVEAYVLPDHLKELYLCTDEYKTQVLQIWRVKG